MEQKGSLISDKRMKILEIVFLRDAKSTCACLLKPHDNKCYVFRGLITYLWGSINKYELFLFVLQRTSP